MAGLDSGVPREFDKDETMEEAKARIKKQVEEYEELVGGNFAGIHAVRSPEHPHEFVVDK